MLFAPYCVTHTSAVTYRVGCYWYDLVTFSSRLGIIVSTSLLSPNSFKSLNALLIIQFIVVICAVTLRPYKSYVDNLIEGLIAVTVVVNTYSGVIFSVPSASGAAVSDDVRLALETIDKVAMGICAVLILLVVVFTACQKLVSRRERKRREKRDGPEGSRGIIECRVVKGGEDGAATSEMTAPPSASAPPL